MLPNGRVAKDGSFRLSTYGNDDGAPIGKYHLTVLRSPPEDESQEDSAMAARMAPYSDPKRPVQVVEVSAQENVLPVIRLK
jgi:hypothetical protein